MYVISYIGERQWQESATSLFPQPRIQMNRVYLSAVSEKKLAVLGSVLFEEIVVAEVN
jgi:hypothetical protein